MNRLILSILVSLVIPNIALASSWETGGFRTANGQLIQRGMTMAQVRRDAGAPMNDKSTDGKSGAGAKSEKASTKGKRGDVWTYKGSDGYYAITFRGGRVAKIEVTAFRGR